MDSRSQIREFFYVVWPHGTINKMAFPQIKRDAMWTLEKAMAAR